MRRIEPNTSTKDISFFFNREYGMNSHNVNFLLGYRNYDAFTLLGNKNFYLLNFRFSKSLYPRTLKKYLTTFSYKNNFNYTCNTIIGWPPTAYRIYVKVFFSLCPYWQWISPLFVYNDNRKTTKSILLLADSI